MRWAWSTSTTAASSGGSASVSVTASSRRAAAASTCPARNSACESSVKPATRTGTGKSERAQQLLTQRCGLLVVSRRPQRLGQVQQHFDGTGFAAQAHVGLQVAPGRARCATAQSFSARLSQGGQGGRVGQSSQHGVLGRLGRGGLAGQEGPERRLVEVGAYRRRLVVDGHADQMVAEAGPPVPGDYDEAGADQGVSSADAASAGPRAAISAATSGRNRPPSTLAARK